MPEQTSGGTRILASVIVPLRHNDGRAVSRRTIKTLRRRLVAISGGYSVQRVRGGWLHESRVFTDNSDRYEAWLRSWRDVPAFLELVDWAREALDQVTMGISIAGIPEEV
ncbi:MAG: hypothetical protein ACKVT1_03790 [Dehalococcoidia bacterium]